MAYNTLGLTRTTYLRFDVPRSDVEAVDTNGATLPTQVNAKVRVRRRPFLRPARWGAGTDGIGFGRPGCVC